MNWKAGSKRGVFFTLDSVFAILILMTLFSVFMLLSVETVSTENIHQQLRFQAEDAVVILAKTTLKEVRYLPVVQEMQASGTLVTIDDDYSIMEVVGALWATNDPANMTYASKLVQQVLGPSMPSSIKWAATIDNDTIFNTSTMANARFMSTVSNRLVSGYMKGKPHVGYTARAFLSNIRGKAENSYLFFGGFTGQGDITGYLPGIPSDANITAFYMEARTGSNFNLFVNGTQCSNVEPATTITINESDTGYLSWDLPNCTKFVRKGNSTKVKIVFTDGNISKQYFGGGYIRVTYQTAIMGSPDSGRMRYYFPGIKGIFNLYDSFFVPGRVLGITGFVNLTSNYSTYIKLGNATIYNRTGKDTGFEATNLLNSTIAVNLSAMNLNYGNISNTTVPIRLGTPEVTFVFGGQASEVVMVTDVSGSMAWCQDQTSGCCNRDIAFSPPPNCDPTSCSCAITSGCSSCAAGEKCGYENSFFNDSGTAVCTKRMTSSNCTILSQKKIEAVKLAETAFATKIFEAEGSRLGIVDYSSSKNGTVVLPDINFTNFTISPTAAYVNKPWAYTYTITLRNDGFAPITAPFTVAIFLPNSGVPPFNITVDPPLIPGQPVTISKTLTQTYLAPTTLIAWADCGGNYSWSGFGTGAQTVEQAYPGLCPPNASKYGVINEYKNSPYDDFDGNRWEWDPWTSPTTNNLRKLDLGGGVNLQAGFLWSPSPDWGMPGYYSTPYTCQFYPSPYFWAGCSVYSGYYAANNNNYYPVICTTNDTRIGRNPYNQTMFFEFNVSNAGALDVNERFNVTLKRWNPKCNYWENVSLGGLGLCNAPSGNCTPMAKNPIEFRPATAGQPTFLGGGSINGTFIWDIENYTPPTCPAGANCSFGQDCNDFNDSRYFSNASFNIFIEVDPEKNVPETNESDNNYTTGPVMRDVPDLQVSQFNPYGDSRCPAGTSIGGPNYVLLNNTSNCPVVEPFEIKFWRHTEWCNRTKVGGQCTSRPGECETEITRNCPNWIFCGNASYNAYVPPRATMAYDLPFVWWTLPLGECMRIGSGPLTEYYAIWSSGYGWWMQSRSNYSTGTINTTVRADTSTTQSNYLYGTWPLFPDSLYSQINESIESNNWRTSTSIVNITLPDLTSAPKLERGAGGPNIKTFTCIYPTQTACFKNVTRGTPNIGPYLINHTVTVANDGGPCHLDANGVINTKLYWNCNSCASLPSGPTGCEGLVWNRTFENLTLVDTPKVLQFNNTWMDFYKDYTVCSWTDTDNNVNESNEANNHNSFTITKRPSDITPVDSTGKGWKITGVAQGVTLDSNGTAHTCYGAKTTTGPKGEVYRYNITGPIRINPSGTDCSFVEDFPIKFGGANQPLWSGLSYFKEGITGGWEPITYYAWFKDKWTSGIPNPIVNYTTRFRDFNVFPGAEENRSIYWNGTIPAYGEDYDRLLGIRLPLYVSLNELFDGCLMQETNISNNWFTDPNFAIDYSAPDLVVLGVASNRTGSVFTVNVTIMNNGTSLGQCGTSLQATSFKVRIWDTATGGVYWMNQSVTSLDAQQIRIVQFTYDIGSDDAREMRAYVDFDFNITELNETNNDFIFQLRKSGGSGAPPEHNRNVLLEPKPIPKKGSEELLEPQTPKTIPDPLSSAAANPIPTNPVQLLQEPEQKRVSPFSALLVYGSGEKKRSASLAGGGGGGCNYDEVCDVGEDCQSCPLDCGICPKVCGKYGCQPGETCLTCPADCGACSSVCGDALCNGAETCATCPADCGICCGNGVCSGGETCLTCPLDCGACPVVCGSWGCQPPTENCSSCPADCGGPCPVVCGSYGCQTGETCQSCPTDCGACCGNGACDFGETCSTCPQDCGICTVCGDGTCNGAENCAGCPQDCGNCQPTCTVTANVTSGIGPFSVNITAHPVYADVCGLHCQAGFADSIMADKTRKCDYGAVSTTTIYQAGASCYNSSTMIFSNPCFISITDLPACGDGTCSAGETCATCPADCGACPICDNDGWCEAGETISSCPFDCDYICGDANHDLAVDAFDLNYIPPNGAPYSNASADVNLDHILNVQDVIYLSKYLFQGGPEPCALCGNGHCDNNESCSNCSIDCGICAGACTIYASPSIGVEPLISTVMVTYPDLAQNQQISLCCDGASGCSTHTLDAARRANKSCTYNTAGNYKLNSTHSISGENCTAPVTVSTNIWKQYSCPDVLETHIKANASYKNWPIYTDSIVGKVNLTNSTKSAEVYNHILTTETLHETCICCGILEAVDMFRNDPDRQAAILKKPASMVILSDGQPNVACKGNIKWSQYWSQLNGNPYDDVINASCIAKKYNITVYTVGFGSEVDKTLMNLTAHACGGMGDYYYANNTSELIDRYTAIAASILNVSFTTQAIQITGSGYTNSTLDENSYLEFTYAPYSPPLGWNDITVTLETSNFSSCTGGNFSVSPNVTAYRAMATSYSGSYWTSGLQLNKKSVFNLDSYLPAGINNYKELGDPFNIQFAPAFLSSSSTTIVNNITYIIGDMPGDVQTPDKCGIHNKLIYTAKFPAAVPFSSILPNAVCRRVEVYYDLNGDGDALDSGEGSVILFIGQGLIGINCDGAPPTPITLAELKDDAKTNVLAEALLRLLDQLNFVKSGACPNSPSGSACNPIDIYLDPNRLATRASSIYEVPYMWGPVDVGIKVWVD